METSDVGRRMALTPASPPRRAEPFARMVDGIRGDVGRYVFYMREDRILGPKRPAWLWATLRNQGLQAQLVFRFGKWLSEVDPQVPGARLALGVLKVAYALAHRLVEITTGISIAEGAEIGPGLYIPHFGGVIIGTVVIGSNCTVANGAHVAPQRTRGSSGCPRLGDRVFLGPGSKVFGDLSIGDDVAVGANAVVTTTVPARAVVVGAPARVTSYRGSFDILEYPGMDADQSRRASLEAADSDLSESADLTTLPAKD